MRTEGDAADFKFWWTQNFSHLELDSQRTMFRRLLVNQSETVTGTRPPKRWKWQPPFTRAASVFSVLWDTQIISWSHLSNLMYFNTTETLSTNHFLEKKNSPCRTPDEPTARKCQRSCLLEPKLLQPDSVQKEEKLKRRPVGPAVDLNSP